MKLKNLLMATIAFFGLALISNAQIPDYVPSNGLVAWWPFNGNANDESLNGYDGIVNGATLSLDRFGNTNKAYSFDGLNDWIQITDFTENSFNGDFTISLWCSFNLFSNDYLHLIYGENGYIVMNGNGPSYLDDSLKISTYQGPILNPSLRRIPYMQTSNSFSLQNNQNIILRKTNNEANIYVNGVLNATILVDNSLLIPSGNQLFFGSGFNNTANYCLNGSLDDIGIWNRALTQEEITTLFNAPNCSYNLSITPSTNQFETGSTANFIATTSDTFPSFVWQSDFGQGFQTLNDYGNYSGVNTNSLSISNVQLSEHNQPIRVISTSGECIDTSNVATINITDTCIITINDTITTLISVTDTLVINTLITDLTPPNNSNTIKVFPNPANSHITIDFGNFESMNGYTLTITNSIGQTVYTTPINEQSSYVDLSTWSGNGIYFVQIIDTQNNTIENRKIVLQ